MTSTTIMLLTLLALQVRVLNTYSSSYSYIRQLQSKMQMSRNIFAVFSSYGSEDPFESHEEIT